MSEFIHAMRKWPEKANFCIDRPNGIGFYTFVQFHNAVDIFYEGKWQKAEAGSIIMYAPNSKQLWKSTDTVLLHDWFHADGRIEPIYKKFGFETDKLYFTDKLNEISKVIGELEYNQFSDSEYKNEYFIAKLTELFILISMGANQKRVTYVDAELKSRIRKVRNEAFLDLSKHNDVPSLAKKAAVSEPHFYAVYKKMFGISPAKDLLNARIHRAKTLLLQGNSVLTVSEQVGFLSEYQFIRSFKKYVGMTPGAYKKQY